MATKHKGWAITYDQNRPVTGTYRAERFGVGMCNNTYQGLINMIDTREKEELELRKSDCARCGTSWADCRCAYCFRCGKCQDCKLCKCGLS